MKMRLMLGLVLGLMLIAAPLMAQAPPAAPAAPAAPPAPPKVQPPKTQVGPKASVGQPFADFELPMAFENKLQKLSAILKDSNSRKVTVITFTNTSCASCQDEINVLATLKTKHKDALQVICVVTDYNAKRIADALGDDVKKAFKNWLSDPYFTVPIQYGIKATPGTVYVGSNGKVIDIVEGFVPTDEGRAELTAKIEEMLK